MDTRRYCEGIRLHPLLGGILASGARSMRKRFSKRLIRNDKFNMFAIPYLARMHLIYKVEGSKTVPEGLRPDLHEMAMRCSGSPIWFPTNELAEKWIFIWDELMPYLVDDEIKFKTINPPSGGDRLAS